MAKNLQCLLEKSKEAGRYLLDYRCYCAFTKDLLLQHNLILIQKYCHLEVSRRNLVVSKKTTKADYVEGRIFFFLHRTTSQKFLAFISKASTKLLPLMKWGANVEFSVCAEQIRIVEDTNPGLLKKDNVFQLVYQEVNDCDEIQVGIEYFCAPDRHVKRKYIKVIRSFCREFADEPWPDKYHPGIWRTEVTIPYYDCCDEREIKISGCTVSNNFDEDDQTEDEESERMQPYLIYDQIHRNKACLDDSGYVALTDSSQRHIAADTVKVPKDSRSSVFYALINEEDVCSSATVNEYEKIKSFRPSPPPLRLPEISPMGPILAQESSKMHEEHRGNSPTIAAALVSAVCENTTEVTKVDCECERNSQQRSRPNCRTTESALTGQHASYAIKGQTAQSPAVIASISCVTSEYRETCQIGKQEKSVRAQKISVDSSAFTNCSITKPNNHIVEKLLGEMNINRDMTRIKRPYSAINLAIAFGNPTEEHDKNSLANHMKLNTKIGQKKSEDPHLTENIDRRNDKKSFNDNALQNIDLSRARDNFQGNKILSDHLNITDERESNLSDSVSLHSDLLSLNLSEVPDSEIIRLQEQQRYNSSSNNAMMTEHKSGIIDKKETSNIPSNHEPNTKDIEVQTSLSLAAGIVLKDKSPDNADHKDKSSDNTDQRDKSPLNTDHPCAHSVYQDRSKMDGCNCPRTDHGYYDSVSVTDINHSSNCAANNNFTPFPFNHQYVINAMPYGSPIEYNPHEVVVGSPIEYYPHGQMPDGFYHPQPYSRPHSVYYPRPGPQNLQQRWHSVYHQQPVPQNLQQRWHSVYNQPSDPPDPEQRAQRCMQCCTNSPCQPKASRHCQ